MPYRTDLTYSYDGSFEGLLCCVFESYLKKEIPAAIFPDGQHQGLLYRNKAILTDVKKAKRVADSIQEKISRRALRFVLRTFLTCLASKELYILRFLRRGYREGDSILLKLTDPVVSAMAKAVTHLESEACLLLGFVRFSDYGGVLVSVIEPKNYALPLLANHFCDRLRGEAFLLYDKTHQSALLYKEGHKEIVPMEEIVLPAAGEGELYFQALWKKFYDTIAIEGRYNPKCRMTHMPQRYWANMTEFSNNTNAPNAVANVGKSKNLPL
jgi:probable DNA metabolism protein